MYLHFWEVLKYLNHILEVNRTMKEHSQLELVPMMITILLQKVSKQKVKVDNIINTRKELLNLNTMMEPTHLMELREFNKSKTKLYFIRMVMNQYITIL
jgi:hypothetical protein